MANIEALSAWSEFFVGFMLAGIGIWAFRAAAKITIHYTNIITTVTRTNVHVHSSEHAHNGETDATNQHNIVMLRYAFGALHGAAGTGLPSSRCSAVASTTTHANAVYLGTYFVAAVAAMAAFGAIFGLLGRGGKPQHIRYLMHASALAAIIIGGYWVSTTIPV